jgi:cellulose synthase/poly-beta-1,6-N-acetylglucosamine synthase-like glycosyltransferase
MILKIEDAEKDLFDIRDREFYLKLEAIPYKKIENKIIIVTSIITPELINWVGSKYVEYEFIIAPFASILSIMRKFFIEEDTNHAIFHLSNVSPKKSAKNIKLLHILIITVAIFITLSIIFKNDFFYYGLILSNILCSFATIFKISLFLIGYRDVSLKKQPPIKLDNIKDEELPIYTILIALYKEKEVVADLVDAISLLDYPKSKLDVKIILEKDDKETINAISKLNHPPYFDIIILPHSLPKTKAKALNYGLLYARGKYVTVYDAEDKPDIDQLKKAYLVFKNSSSKVSCIQANLVCHNDRQTIISRMFSLEYVIWFEFVIKSLEKLNLPIMLGGTSNHFIKDNLVASGAWDPFNVTEDADLGLRIWSSGFKSKLFKSNTQEEAVTNIKTWVNQRSRWIKGYFMTILVHLKNRKDLKKSLGNRSALAIELFILSNSLFFIMNFINIIGNITILLRNQSHSLLSNICILNLYLTFLAPIIMSLLTMYYQKKKIIDILLTIVIFPFYLMLHNLAASKAIYQLFTDPFHWEKTPHGFSKK